MTYMEYLKKEIESGNPMFLLSLSATKEEILNADADELAKIINERPLYTSDRKPRCCYCVNCGRKGVSLSECHTNIKKTLMKETRN